MEYIELLVSVIHPGVCRGRVCPPVIVVVWVVPVGVAAWWGAWLDWKRSTYVFYKNWVFCLPVLVYSDALWENRYFIVLHLYRISSNSIATELVIFTCSICLSFGAMGWVLPCLVVQDKPQKAWWEFIFEMSSGWIYGFITSPSFNLTITQLLCLCQKRTRWTSPWEVGTQPMWQSNIVYHDTFSFLQYSLLL